VRFLFVHQNFPAQFGRLAAWLTQMPQHQVVYLTRREDIEFAGIRKAIFKEHRGAADATHAYLRPVEDAVLQGQAAYRTAAALKQQGFVPDVIYSHSGFGAMYYLKDVFPHSALVGFFEWYYHARGTEVDFDPNEKITEDDECRIRTRNMLVLPDLVSSDAGVTPTYWQHRQFPEEYSAKLQVIHDGIDVSYFAPAQEKDYDLPTPKLDLSTMPEIVTYVSRGMESMRGFPQFMEAMSKLMARRKQCHVVVVGTDRIAYAPTQDSGKGLKDIMLEKYPFDMERIHFTGPLPYAEYKKVLLASTVHVYLTRPFVLSWSMLEAMSCECALVASDTAPVREVIRNDENGLLVDFFNTEQLSDKVAEALDDAGLRRRIGANARATILSRYDMQKTLPRHLHVLESATRR